MQISEEEYTELKKLLDTVAGNETLQNIRRIFNDCGRTHTDDPLHNYVKKNLCNDEIEIDPSATTSSSQDGSWVSARLWVSRQELLEIGAEKATTVDVARMVVSFDVDIVSATDDQIFVKPNFDSEITFEPQAKTALTEAIHAEGGNINDFLPPLKN